MTPRPFLKWVGGKGQLIEQYQPFIPKQFRTYHEPFLGGGAVFFHLLPKQAFLTDINPELVNVYLCVRDHVQDLIALLDIHRQNHSKDYYYQVRATRSGNHLERAARLLYLNKTCFNGLYRENLKGEFNVPMGRYKNPRVLNEEMLWAASEALQNAQIGSRPFPGVLEMAQPEDFVYFDPPYYPISPTSNFTTYSRSGFGVEEQLQLQSIFAMLADRGVKVMLSNSDCPFIRGLYQDFKIHTITATRSINSDPGKRGRITEVLVTSY